MGVFLQPLTRYRVRLIHRHGELDSACFATFLPPMTAAQLPNWVLEDGDIITIEIVEGKDDQ
jgi:hypothetical protein